MQALKDRGDRGRASKDRTRRSSRERGGSCSRADAREDRGRERDPRDSRNERDDEDRRKRTRSDVQQK